LLPLKDNYGRHNFAFTAPMASADGYGYSAEELARAASKQGANIGYVVHDWNDKKYTGQDVQDLEIKREDIGKYEVSVVYFIPYAFQHFQSAFTYGMTMFETTEIPDIWAYCCDMTQGVIVPSQFCKEIFQKKLTVPVEVAPLGVNPEVYPFVKRTPSNVFTFLMAGMLHYRKGAEFAVRAFKDEFGPNEDVRLILKTRKSMLDLGAETADDPRIQIVDGDYTREQMLDLYHAADCFIACSRGEASGLTPREAMSTGVPAIVTNWGGLQEIADPRYTYPLDIVGLNQAPIECSSYSLGITQGQSIGEFSVPSVAHLRQLMREAYENPEQNLAKGKAASDWVKTNWSYDTCATQWLEAIERLHNA
jgi:glycosyltransferase involved in cell wall biosynthesis